MRRRNDPRRAAPSGWAWWAALGAVVLVRLPHAFAGRFFDADEAGYGLMGLSMLRGDVPLYAWGLGYGNPAVAALAAPFLAVIPSARVATQLAPCLLHLSAVALLSRLARVAAGETAGMAVLLAAALLPAPLSALALAHGARTVTVSCGVVAWALVLGGGQSRRAAFALGLIAGLGWWNEPSVLIYLAPASWLLVRAWRRSLPAAAWVAAAITGLAAGGGPHVYGVLAGLAGVRPAPEWLRAAYPWPALQNLFGAALPALLGADVLPADAGPLGPLLAAAALVGAGSLTALAWFAHRERGQAGRPRAELLLCADGAALLFVLAWVALGVDGFAGRRYALLLWPSAVVWAGLGIDALWPRRRRLAAALLVTWAACWAVCGVLHWRRTAAAEVPVADAVGLLDAERVSGAFANYWASNLVTLATRERIVVAQLTGVPLRHRAYYGRLERVPSPGYLFNPSRWPEDAGLKSAVTAELRRRRIPFRLAARGEWELVAASGPGLPLRFINDLRLAPGREELRRRLGGG